MQLNCVAPSKHKRPKNVLEWAQNFRLANKWCKYFLLHLHRSEYVPFIGIISFSNLLARFNRTFTQHDCASHNYQTYEAIFFIFQTDKLVGKSKWLCILSQMSKNQPYLLFAVLKRTKQNTTNIRPLDVI